MLINRYLFFTFLLSQCALLAHTDSAFSIGENDILGYSVASVVRANPGLVQQLLIDDPKAWDKLKDRPHSELYEAVSPLLDEDKSEFFLHMVINSLKHQFLPGFSWVYGMSPGVDWRATYNASPAMQKGFESHFKLPSPLPVDEEEKVQMLMLYEAIKGRFAQDWILATQEYDSSIKPDFEVKYTKQADLLKYGSLLFSEGLDIEDKDAILDAVRIYVDSNRYGKFSNLVASMVVDKDLSTEEKLKLIALLGLVNAKNYQEAVDAFYTLLTRVTRDSVEWDKARVINHICQNNTPESALPYMNSVNGLLKDKPFSYPGEVMAALTKMAGEERDYKKAAAAVKKLLDWSSSGYGPVWFRGTVKLLEKMGPKYEMFLDQLCMLSSKNVTTFSMYANAIELEKIPFQHRPTFVKAYKNLVARATFLDHLNDHLNDRLLTMVLESLAKETPNYNQFLVWLNKFLPSKHDVKMLSQYVKALQSVAPEDRKAYVDFLGSSLRSDMKALDRQNLVVAYSNLKPDDYKQFDLALNLLTSGLPEEKRATLALDLSEVPPGGHSEFMKFLQEIDFKEWQSSLLGLEIKFLAKLSPNHRQAFKDIYSKFSASSLSANIKLGLVFELSKFEPDNYKRLLATLSPSLESDVNKRYSVLKALEALSYYDNLSPEDYSEYLNDLFPLMGDTICRNRLIQKMMQAVGRKNWRAFSEQAKSGLNSLDGNQLAALRKTITADNFAEELDKAFKAKSALREVVNDNRD